MGRVTSRAQHPRARKWVLRERPPTRGWRPHGPIPKIVSLALTSTVTMGVSAWATIPRADPPPRVLEAVFLGDSYTVGVGSDGSDWPTAVAMALGWKSVNLALGGTGYATESGMKGCGREHCGAYLEQSAAIASDPDIIVVSGGRNDPPGSIGAAALTLFRTLRVEHPDADIIALSPWTDDDAPPEAFTVKVTAVQKAAADAGITYVDTGQPFVGHPDLISVDGVHPNTAGYVVLSSLLTAKLAAATGQTLLPKSANPAPMAVDSLSENSRRQSS